MASVLLIAEDETLVRIVAESVLERAGYETISAGTVAEALAIIETDHHRIDLLFTDLGFGGDAEGGLTIAAAFSKARPGAPVLYATARELTDGMKALFAEPHGFMPKPYTVGRLKTSIANLLS